MSDIREIADKELKKIAFDSEDLSVEDLREEFKVDGMCGYMLNDAYVIGMQVHVEFFVKRRNFPGSKALIERDKMFVFLEQRYRHVYVTMPLFDKMFHPDILYFHSRGWTAYAVPGYKIKQVSRTNNSYSKEDK
jgi:hypothetical protein